MNQLARSIEGSGHLLVLRIDCKSPHEALFQKEVFVANLFISKQVFAFLHCAVFKQKCNFFLITRAH
jgi:hypothetical protein